MTHVSGDCSRDSRKNGRTSYTGASVFFIPKGVKTLFIRFYAVSVFSGTRFTAKPLDVRIAKKGCRIFMQQPF